MKLKEMDNEQISENIYCYELYVIVELHGYCIQQSGTN